MKRIIFVLILTSCIFDVFSQQKGTFTDNRDGKVYNTVTIGTQTWFAQNLTYKPSNGNLWAYDNDQSNVTKYGYLYDWETAKNVCPSGWHLPSDTEWDKLIIYLGSYGTVSGNKMKSVLGWNSPSGATNESNFFAKPAGMRTYDVEYLFGGKGTYFWSKTRYDNSDIWIIELSDKGSVSKENIHSMNGFSVRCIKD